MHEYSQYCPVFKASETLGDTWTLLIVREMLFGASGFNELRRGLPGISRSVLVDRMRAMERAGIVERMTSPSGKTQGYALTSAGRDLRPVLIALGEWGATWSITDPRPEELDLDLVMHWIARQVDRAEVPDGRTVLQFDVPSSKRRYWMVLEPSEVSVCLKHPGLDIDLQLTSDAKTLYRLYLGQVELGGAMRAGVLSMSGPLALQRGVRRWFMFSAFGPAVRAAETRRKAAVQLPVRKPVRTVR